MVRWPDGTDPACQLDELVQAIDEDPIELFGLIQRYLSRCLIGARFDEVDGCLGGRQCAGAELLAFDVVEHVSAELAQGLYCSVG